MNQERLSRLWKDPDRRTDNHGADHPAGEIELNLTGGTDNALSGLPETMAAGCMPTITHIFLCCDPITVGA